MGGGLPGWGGCGLVQLPLAETAGGHARRGTHAFLLPVGAAVLSFGRLRLCYSTFFLDTSAGCDCRDAGSDRGNLHRNPLRVGVCKKANSGSPGSLTTRSEEHTSEL